VKSRKTPGGFNGLLNWPRATSANVARTNDVAIMCALWKFVLAGRKTLYYTMGGLRRPAVGAWVVKVGGQSAKSACRRARLTPLEAPRTAKTRARRVPAPHEAGSGQEHGLVLAGASGRLLDQDARGAAARGE